MNGERDLATRLEGITSAERRAFVESANRVFPDSEAAWIDIDGAVGVFLEAGSALNGTFGLGMAGEVLDEQIESLELFFRNLGERPAASVCPLAHPSVGHALAARGWTTGAFEHVLVRELDARERLADPPDGVDIRLAETSADRELWASLVAEAFSAPDVPTRVETRVGRIAVEVPGKRFLLALVDGEPAGTGELQIDGEIAWLSADATMPRFRRRGVQGALQRARLAMAAAAGCAVAVTEAAPFSASQRNMERLGFRVVYTRAESYAPEGDA